MSFTHFDPFEDTERTAPVNYRITFLEVSPTSIRSRILKVLISMFPPTVVFGFTHFDPFEDTERTMNISSVAGP